MHSYVLYTLFVTISSAINGQRFPVNNLNTGIVFPDDDVVATLDSFRSSEGFPQIYLPQSFILAARGKHVPIGRSSMGRCTIV